MYLKSHTRAGILPKVDKLAQAATIHTNKGDNEMNNLFTYRNIAIAVVVALVVIIGYYAVKPKAATAPAAKPAVSAPAAPAAPAKK